MKMMLLAAAGSLAAIGALGATPASARDGSNAQFASAPGVLPQPRIPSGPFVSGDVRRGHRDGRRHRGSGDGVFVGGWGWDSDVNRGWEPDSFNDWWHDRPDRAFPRWMQNNQNCERLWWSGGGWRC
jgi:hypothetical protein